MWFYNSTNLKTPTLLSPFFFLSSYKCIFQSYFFPSSLKYPLLLDNEMKISTKNYPSASIKKNRGSVPYSMMTKLWNYSICINGVMLPVTKQKRIRMRRPSSIESTNTASNFIIFQNYNLAQIEPKLDLDILFSDRGWIFSMQNKSGERIWYFLSIPHPHALPWNSYSTFTFRYLPPIACAPPQFLSLIHISEPTRPY